MSVQWEGWSSLRLLWAWRFHPATPAMVHNDHKRADNLFSSEVCRLNEPARLKEEHKGFKQKGSYPKLPQNGNRVRVLGKGTWISNLKEVSSPETKRDGKEKKRLTYICKWELLTFVRRDLCVFVYFAGGQQRRDLPIFFRDFNPFERRKHGL